MTTCTNDLTYIDIAVLMHDGFNVVLQSRPNCLADLGIAENTLWRTTAYSQAYGDKLIFKIKRLGSDDTDAEDFSTFHGAPSDLISTYFTYEYADTEYDESKWRDYLTLYGLNLLTPVISNLRDIDQQEPRYKKWMCDQRIAASFGFGKDRRMTVLKGRLADSRLALSVSYSPEKLASAERAKQEFIEHVLDEKERNW